MVKPKKPTGSSHVDLNVKYFNPSEQIKDGNMILIVGRRGSGKSVLAADILSYFRHVKRALVISATEGANGYWGQFVPGCFVHNEFNDKLIEDLFSSQEEIKAQTGKLEPAICILDDMLWNKDVVKSTSVRKMFFNARHQNVTCMVLAQDPMILPPALRANCDLVMCLQDPVLRNRERLYYSFGGVMPSFKSFDALMRATTENREAMIMDMRQLSYSPEESVFFYKATPDLRFRTCSERYWEFSRQVEAAKQSRRQGGGFDSDIDDEDSPELRQDAMQRGKLSVRKQYPKASKQSRRQGGRADYDTDDEDSPELRQDAMQRGRSGERRRNYASSYRNMIRRPR